MDYKTHRVAGACTGILVSALVLPEPYTKETLLIYGLITLSSTVGSYIPDIDEPKSKIGKLFKPISRTVKTIAGHRGFVHTPVMALLLLFLLLFVKSNFINAEYLLYFEYILLGVICGFLSHLFVDTLTVSGIRWFWPISTYQFSIASLQTNNKFHQFLVKSVFIILTFLFLYTFKKTQFAYLF